MAINTYVSTITLNYQLPMAINTYVSTITNQKTWSGRLDLKKKTTGTYHVLSTGGTPLGKGHT